MLCSPSSYATALESCLWDSHLFRAWRSGGEEEEEVQVSAASRVPFLSLKERDRRRWRVRLCVHSPGEPSKHHLAWAEQLLQRWTELGFLDAHRRPGGGWITKKLPNPLIQET